MVKSDGEDVGASELGGQDEGGKEEEKRNEGVGEEEVCKRKRRQWQRSAWLQLNETFR